MTTSARMALKASGTNSALYLGYSCAEPEDAEIVETTQRRK
jgi:hypothetical protein